MSSAQGDWQGAESGRTNWNGRWSKIIPPKKRRKLMVTTLQFVGSIVVVWVYNPSKPTNIPSWWVWGPHSPIRSASEPLPTWEKLIIDMKRDRPWMIHFAIWNGKKIGAKFEFSKWRGNKNTRITKTTWTLCLLCPFETWCSLEVSTFSWVYSWLCHLQGVLRLHYEIWSLEERNLEVC